MPLSSLSGGDDDCGDGDGLCRFFDGFCFSNDEGLVSEDCFATTFPVCFGVGVGNAATDAVAVDDPACSFFGFGFNCC